jgi:hypothetical protein
VTGLLGSTLLNLLKPNNSIRTAAVSYRQTTRENSRFGKREGTLEKRLFINFEVLSWLFIGGRIEPTKNLRTIKSQQKFERKKNSDVQVRSSSTSRVSQLGNKSCYE